MTVVSSNGRTKRTMKRVFLLFVMGITGFATACPAQEIGALQYLRDAENAYSKIQSYHCKATNVVMKYGLLGPKRYFNLVRYSFEKPNHVRMEWIAPGLLKGQVAVYREKALIVKMRFMPFAIAMDPDGFLAQDPAGNRIHKTHIGYLLETLMAAITPETKITLADGAKFQSAEKGIPVVVENNQGKVIVFLDPQLKIPIAMEFYGPDGRLQQACTFEDLVLNVKFGPKEFEIN